MKSIDEIFAEGRTPEQIIADLKSYRKFCPAWSDLEKDFDPAKHPIVADPTLRPKEKKKNGSREIPAKLTYPAERIASRRMTQMAFSIPVKRVYNATDDDNEKAFQDAIEMVYDSVRIDGVNSRRMFAYFSSCEIATFWFAVDSEKSNRYGFESDVKLRCRSFSPMPTKYSKFTQANIYPYFDDTDDLIALSVEYVDDNGNDSTSHFDCFTAKKIYYYSKSGNEYNVVVQDNVIGKIPAAYLSRPLAIYDGISDNRNDIEFTLSRNSDNIRKNSSPIIKITGELKGEAPVGDQTREVYRLEQGGDVNLVSPALTTSDAKSHIEVLKQMIEESIQLPNLSMENVKGLGAISGEARKTLLTDAHLKVREEAHDICWFLDREFAVIKSMLVTIRPDWKKYEHTTTAKQIITPFIQSDKAADIANFAKAAGVLMSNRSAVREAALVDDPDADYEMMLEEKKAEAEISRMNDVFEGAE